MVFTLQDTTGQKNRTSCYQLFLLRIKLSTIKKTLLPPFTNIQVAKGSMKMVQQSSFLNPEKETLSDGIEELSKRYKAKKHIIIKKIT